MVIAIAWVEKRRKIGHQLTYIKAEFQRTPKKNQRSTLSPTPTSSKTSFRISPNFTSNTNPSSRISKTPLPHPTAKNISKAKRSARSSTVSTNAFSVPAAQHPAHHTGGTARSTSGPQSWCRVTDGWQIREIRITMRERRHWIIAWVCIDAILFWTAREHVLRDWTPDWRLRRSRRRWLFKKLVAGCEQSVEGLTIGSQNDDGMKRFVGGVGLIREPLWGDVERCGLIVRPCRYYASLHHRVFMFIIIPITLNPEPSVSCCVLYQTTSYPWCMHHMSGKSSYFTIVTITYPSVMVSLNYTRSYLFYQRKILLSSSKLCCTTKYLT